MTAAAPDINPFETQSAAKPKPKPVAKPAKGSMTQKVVERKAKRQLSSTTSISSVGILEEWIEIAALYSALGIVTFIPLVIGFWVNVGRVVERVSESRIAQLLNLSPEESETQNISNANGSAISQAAMKWVGKSFNPGVAAQCAVFVRAVLEDAGINLNPSTTSEPLDGIATSEAFANSFGPDQGQLIERKKDLQAGDIVMFLNTYGDYAPGTITHVGVYTGDGMMVDRPTASAPVKHRSIDTFEFAGAIRLQSLAAFTAEAYKAWVANQESSSKGCGKSSGYGAINCDSGALGKYQFMPDTMKSNALQCKGVQFEPTEQEFLSTPSLQEKVMDCYLNSALKTIQKKTDDPLTQCRMMASYHYSGNPDLYNNGNRQFYGGNEYPSIADYTSDVCKEILQ